MRGDHEARELAAYLMTCASSNMIGLYYLPMALVADELGYESAREVRAVLRRVEETAFCRYDDDTRYVYIPSMAREQIGESLAVRDKRVIGIERELERHRRSPFYNDFLARYRDAYHLRVMPEARPRPALIELPSDLVREAPSKPLPKPLRSQDQDQDQDQEHREARERAPASAELPLDRGPTCTRPTLGVVRLDGPAALAERLDGEPEVEVRSTYDLVRLRFSERFLEARGGPPGWGKTAVTHAHAIASWLDGHGGDPEVLLGRMLEGFFGDAWAASKSYPLGALAHDPVRYLNPPKAAPPDKPRGFCAPSPASAFQPTDIESVFERLTRPGGQKT